MKRLYITIIICVLMGVMVPCTTRFALTSVSDAFMIVLEKKVSTSITATNAAAAQITHFRFFILLSPFRSLHAAGDDPFLQMLFPVQEEQ